MTLVKLIAFDAEDLAVLSAHVQDACVQAADMAYLPREQRFALIAERFCRESGQAVSEKRRAGLHVERVVRVRSQGVTPGGKDKLQLLALQFQLLDAPSGILRLLFAGNAEIRLDVECLEAAMSDLNEGGQPETCPYHALNN